MFLLDRYLFIQFLKNFTLVLCALVSIYFLVDFFERIDNFVDADKKLSLALRYFILKIPTMVDIIYPVSILLAGVITLGLLNHNFEFTALKAGGVSVNRVCLPLLLSALLLTLGALAMAEWLLPKTLVESNRIWYEEVNNKVPKGILRKGRIYHKGNNGIYSFSRPNPTKNIFYKFSYSEWDTSYNITLHFTAQKARWTDGQWTFWRGQIKKPGLEKTTEQKITVFDKINLNLPENPEDFFVPEYRSNELALSTLLAQSRTNSPESSEAWLSFNNRLSFILIGLPLILIGLPVLLIIHQRWGHDLTIAIPVSCGLAFAAWGWWSTAQSMAKAYSINPIFSAWSIHLLAGSLGLWLLSKQDA